MQLTPSTSWEATKDNYCYWDGSTAREPKKYGHLFLRVEGFARRIYDDYGWETSQTTGEPLGPLILDDSIDPAYIGDWCVIGRPGFNWLMIDKLKRFHTRFPHIGGITFGDNVTLDDFVTIDRGGVGDTIIGSDVHIDSHVHVGHNARIDNGVQITAGAIIGGGATIGNDVFIGLGAIIRNKVVIGDGAVIGMGAVVVEDVPDGETWVGNPARELP